VFIRVRSLPAAQDYNGPYAARGQVTQYG
jgi:hypothetical protein